MTEGPALMAIWAVRDFECEICRQSFSRGTCDFIAPGDTICDECLAEIASLEEEDLTEFVSQQLTENYPEYEEKKRHTVLKNILWFKKTSPSSSEDV